MTIASGVSGPEMMANLAQIARWQKYSGTAEERTALAFLEGRMNDYGFTTKTLLHDAYISLPGRASVLVDGRAVTAITHSFSRRAEGLSGAPVYLGRGTDADFAGRDVRGRIVLLEGMATPATAQRASRAGAAAQLHISHHEHLHEMCISPVWGSPSSATLHELPTTVACTISNADGGALRDALAAGATPTVTLHAEVDTGWRKTPILVCDLAGPDEAFVLLSGHHDTWFYGVMDNGSANAGMLEVARLAALHRAAWRRGLRVCFWSGHSHGRYSGSAWYADSHWQELDARCVAHVNVDSLGGAGASVLSDAAAMAELTHLAAEAVRLHADQPHHGARKARNSDESFGGIGIPSMFGAISEQPARHAQARNALGWWWHTPHDLIDKVDEAKLVRDTRVLAHAVARLLGDALLPLDHAASVAELLVELRALDAALGGRLPVAPLIAAAEHLHATAARIPAMRQAGDLPRANAALMRASRALVPADYAGGERFAHLPALPVPAWAVLEPLRALAATTADTDAARFAAVEAMRARNRLAHALRQAQSALDDTIAALGR
jgi:hypothetical protein